jgi:hypothetical protein
MPIRFRCAYCSQLMGIATRKAGTVVTCPKCGGQVVVPTPDPDQAAEEERQRATGPSGAAVFEEDDEVQKLLEYVEETARPSPLAQPVRRPGGAGSMPPPAPVLPARTMPPPPSRPAAADVDVLPLDMEPAQPRGIHLTPGVLAIVLTLLGLALGLMFLLGFLLGRSTEG